MSSARTSEPVTALEALAFAGAVIGPSWGLGVLIASFYVAGPAFVVLLVPMAFQPVSLLVALLAVAGVTVLVLRVQERWTRAEIALVSCAVLAAALWITPVVLMGDAGDGVVIGLILVVLACAFGPVPLCFWSATRMSRSMRVAVTDPAATSWLRDAVAWGVARYEMVRARSERAPVAGDVPGTAVTDERGEHR
ncbi:hypothetical protein [Mumia sp. DW29H23]|uniref:hypothetical protein n=1 Tax=Mumia sp. DW29H23 TaxID=3421241 RepID=UPI003D6881BC